MHIKRLRLQNFRKFEEYNIELSPAINLIIGDNAKGKSTLLEALYFITNLQSPFVNTFKTLVNFNKKFFRLEAVIDNGVDDFKLAVYYDTKNPRITIDGKSISSDQYSKKSRSILFSAEYIDQLMMSPRQRRKFFDKIAETVGLEYAAKIKKFNKVLKQRNSRLKQLAEDFYETDYLERNDSQIAFWDQKFVEYASWLVKERLKLQNLINSLGKEISVKYLTEMKLGDLTKEIQIDNIQKVYSQALNDNFKKDVFRGYTTIGPQRDDWGIILNKEAFFTENTDIQIKDYGSRGQKRYAIAQLIFIIQEISKKYLDVYPILLLDDVFSELDEKRFTNLLNQDIINKQQTIISSVTTNKWVDGLNLKEEQVIKL